MDDAARGIDALASRLNALADAQPFATSWYVRNLVTGEAADRRGSDPVPSASTRKTSILMAALKAVHEGRLSLDEPITVEAAYQAGVTSGVFQHMTPGYVIPFRDALVQMIITSDNVCTHHVVDRIDLDELNQYCRAIGLTGTVHRFKVPPPDLKADHKLDAVTTTTPTDQGVLLEMILAGTTDAAAAKKLGSTPKLCQWAIEVLTWQVHRNMIPALLPFGTVVANKTGRGPRGRMDAGLVFRAGKPLYVLTAFTDGVPEEMPDGLPGFAAAFATIARMARTCWDSIGRK